MKKLIALALAVILILSIPMASFAADNSPGNPNVILNSAVVIDEKGNEVPVEVIVTPADDNFTKAANALLEGTSTPEEIIETFNLTEEEAALLLTVLNGESVGIVTCAVQRSDYQLADGRYVVTVTVDSNIVAALYMNTNGGWSLAGTKKVGDGKMVLTVEGLPSQVIFLANKKDEGHTSPQTGVETPVFAICGLISLAVAAVVFSIRKKV